MGLYIFTIYVYVTIYDSFFHYQIHCHRVLFNRSALSVAII